MWDKENIFCEEDGWKRDVSCTLSKQLESNMSNKMQNDSRILEALEKVADRLDPPKHYSITLSGKSCNLQQTLSTSIKLNPNKRAEVSLNTGAAPGFSPTGLSTSPMGGTL